MQADCTPLYRAAVYDQNGNFLFAEDPVSFFTEAHMACLNYLDYPRETAILERSLDGGQTWQEYEAREKINGKPAWVVHLDEWNKHTGVT